MNNIFLSLVLVTSSLLTYGDIYPPIADENKVEPLQLHFPAEEIELDEFLMTALQARGVFGLCSLKATADWVRKVNGGVPSHNGRGTFTVFFLVPKPEKGCASVLVPRSKEYDPAWPVVDILANYHGNATLDNVQYQLVKLDGRTLAATFTNGGAALQHDGQPVGACDTFLGEKMVRCTAGALAGISNLCYGSLDNYLCKLHVIAKDQILIVPDYHASSTEIIAHARIELQNERRQCWSNLEIDVGVCDSLPASQQPSCYQSSRRVFQQCYP